MRYKKDPYVVLEPATAPWSRVVGDRLVKIPGDGQYRILSLGAKDYGRIVWIGQSNGYDPGVPLLRTTQDRRDPLTPEQHADRLREEIEYDLAHYGPRSIAAMVATILEENHGEAWGRYAPLFRRIEDGEKP